MINRIFTAHKGHRGRSLSGVSLAVISAALLVFASGQIPALAAESASSTACPSLVEPGDDLTAAELPEGTSAIDCDLIGEVVREGEVAVTIPQPGRGVSATSIGEDGAPEEELTVEVSESGEISYTEHPEDELPSEPDEGQSPYTTVLGACDDTANSELSHTEWGTYNWYVGDGGMPGALSKSDAATAFADAINNITGSYNNCGLEDQVNASASYQGTTTYEADINSSGTCTEEDGKSTWDAGDLPSTRVAITCTHYWAVTYDLYEADVRYNTTDFDFVNEVTSSCVNKYDVRSVGTHEAGHVFGLGHVSGTSHSNQTMYTNSFLCNEKARTLGYGDVLGLRSIY
ncbi:matrixin family metalloprotease [Streptomyces sp. NPDC001914]|uniref:matrixin family metalloprotease n=1 Tax=Streptomyces sp. NPDC001914 TaxID=3364623 RepID=UPI0036934DDE